MAFAVDVSLAGHTDVTLGAVVENSKTVLQLIDNSSGTRIAGAFGGNDVFVLQSDTLNILGTSADERLVVDVASLQSLIGSKSALPSISIQSGEGKDEVQVKTGTSSRAAWTLSSVTSGSATASVGVELLDANQSKLNSFAISIVSVETLTGGEGTDALIGRNVDTEWDVADEGAGAAYGLSFSGFDKIQGGSGLDT
ncbi:MAG TPA: hypothetical protein VGE52_09990, partial [Pirellulales bacterium]